MHLSIGIISCNRLKYLKGLLKSLECLKSESGIEIIVVDNGSTESGLVEYLNSEKSRGFIDKLILNKERDWKNDEYKAKNIIIKESLYDIIFFLQDDSSFIGTKELLSKYIDDLKESDAVCLDVCGVRMCTIFRKIDYSKLEISRNKCKYWGTKDNHFQTMGLFKKYVFRECGNYPIGKDFSSWKIKDKDTIQQEVYYDALVKKKLLSTKRINKVTLFAHIPLFITIWNDPRGGYSFIRDDKRYGHYIDAESENGLYYNHLNNEEIDRLMSYRFPSGFTTVAKPIGWDYAKSENNDQLKYDREKIMKEGPIDNI